jgi:hypothetical protein
VTGETKSYYVGILRGESQESGEYPHSPKDTVAVWHVTGPMVKSLALKLLRQRLLEYGERNVHLFVKAPWATKISVHSDSEVKFVYPSDEEANGD